MLCTPPTPRPHPRHPTLGEKYKASLVWEHRDLSDTALYHGILPLSHNSTHSHTEPSSRGRSFSPLTFSEPLGPWHDAQTTHCTARPISPKVHVNTQRRHGDKTPWRNISGVSFVAGSPCNTTHHKHRDRGDILHVHKHVVMCRLQSNYSDSLSKYIISMAVYSIVCAYILEYK